MSRQAAQEARRLKEMHEQREAQVAQLREHIEGLQGELRARDEAAEQIREEKAELAEDVESLRRTASDQEAALALKDVRVAEMEVQLKQNEDEFDLLSSALAEKDALVNAKNSKILDLEAMLESTKNEVGRHRTMLRGRATAAIRASKPKTEEVCLSARSFAENELIGLRDEALRVKDQQLALVNENNVSLRENIDRLEAEMERLQADLVQRDRAISGLREERDSALERISDLERQVEVKAGREAAMEIATKQNAQLLQLLQQQETHSKELEEKNQALEQEVEAARAKQRALLRSSSEHEATAAAESASASNLRKELQTVRGSWEAEERLLRRKLKQLETESGKTIREQRDELRERRESHYAMLGRVQAAEDKIRATEDEADDLRRRVTDFDSERDEMDARIIEIRRWADAREAQHRRALDDARAELGKANDRAARLEGQRKALSCQLQEMSGTVLRAVDKQKGAIDEAAEVKSVLSEKEMEMQDLQRRMAAEGNLQGKRRMKLELEHRTLVLQLQRLQSENTLLAEATNSNFDAQAKRADELARTCGRLRHQLDEAICAQNARLARIMRFVEAAVLVRSNNAHTLDLSECRIGSSKHVSKDASAAAVEKLCRNLATLLVESTVIQDAPVVLNLALNGLCDDHIADGLSKVLQAPFLASCVTLDLSSNEFTTVGLRTLVLALKRNARIQHVFVHRDGTIQGLRGSEVVFIIELRDNAAQTPPAADAAAALPSLD